MICPSCGSNIADNALFCTKCGYKIEKVNNNTGDRVMPDPYVNAPIEIGTPAIQGSNTKQKEPFVWKDQYTYIAIATAIVIAALVGLGVKLHRASEKTNPTETTIKDSTTGIDSSNDIGNSESTPSEIMNGFNNDDVYTEQDFSEDDEYIADDYTAEEYTDIDVEHEVLGIREEYNTTVERINSGIYESQKTKNGETVYRDGEYIKAIVVPKSVTGEEYAKYYYYTEDGTLYFAYYEGYDAHRFYFLNNQLIRWRYSAKATNAQDATNYDLDDSQDYYDWANIVTQEGNFYINNCSSTDFETDYILPNSDSRYLDKSDLEGMSAEECRLARNELYARHGRMFDDEELQTYFNSKDWYSGRIKPSDFQESMLNDYEVYNRDLIVSFEEDKGYR